MPNEIKFGQTARNKMAEGIKILNDAVRSTIGPKGRNIVIEQDFGAPIIINDGVSIAKAINLKDKYANLGAELIKEAASKTNDLAGDGTSTAVVLASNLILNGIKYLDQGVNPVDIRNGFEYYLPIILNYIQANSVKVKSIDDIKQIATISSGSNEIGSIIAEAYNAVGYDGEVSVEESQGYETYLQTTIGYAYDRGYASSYMAMSKDSNLAILEDAKVLVTDKKIASMKEILTFLEDAAKSGKPLLIVCDDIEPEVLNTIVMNKLRGVFNVVITKAPSFGDKKIKLLTDIAIATNAHFVALERGENLSSSSLDVLGSAKKIIVDQIHTLIIEGGSDKEIIDEYVANLRKEQAMSTSSYDKEQLATRIAHLTSGVAVIKCGARTEVELKEKKLRLEDALCATSSSLKTGTNEGGGKVFYELSQTLVDNPLYHTSYEIIKETLKVPFRQIVENAGKNFDEIKSLVNKEKWYNCATDEIVNLRSAGVIDPTGVLVNAIANALSIAGSFLTTEGAIISLDDKSEIDEDNLL